MNAEIDQHLESIEQQHEVTIITAIESGSRAWGFPSPDSDYDVRFVYAHPKDWYIQLDQQRDVIEVPINEVLDISGWDIKKAFQLANSGNAVIQEWIKSPIVYRQSTKYRQAAALISQAFNPVAAFYHYRSMAKKALGDLEISDQKRLKRFFYFARATLSAWWISLHQTMPSIEFKQLLTTLPIDPSLVAEVTELIAIKAREPEASNLEFSGDIFDTFYQFYHQLPDSLVLSNEDRVAVSNQHLRSVLSDNI